MKNFAQSLKIIALAVVLSFGISYVYAWTAPTATPPNGNVSAPINTSTTSQIKGATVNGVRTGGFGVEGLIRGYSNAIFDGKVGIGTTTPSSMLEVHSGTTYSDPQFTAHIKFNDNFGGGALGVSGVATPINRISLATGVNTLTERLSINQTSGNVGIGTTAPGAQLHIGKAEVPSPAPGTVTRMAIQPYGHTGGPWYFKARDTSSKAFLDIVYGVNTTGLTQDNDGNVGIGTTVPGAKLSVDGTVVSKRGMYLNGQVDCTGGISFGATNYVCNTPYITTTLGATGAVGRYPYTDDNMGEVSMKGVCGATGGKINGASATFANT